MALTKQTNHWRACTQLTISCYVDNAPARYWTNQPGHLRPLPKACSCQICPLWVDEPNDSLGMWAWVLPLEYAMISKAVYRIYGVVAHGTKASNQTNQKLPPSRLHGNFDKSFSFRLGCSIFQERERRDPYRIHHSGRIVDVGPTTILLGMRRNTVCFHVLGNCLTSLLMVLFL